MPLHSVKLKAKELIMGMKRKTMVHITGPRMKR